MKLRYKFLSVLLICLIMVGIVQLALAADNVGFTDVTSSAWYAEAVNWCAENNIMSGTSEREFSPDASMSRAMLATVLWRLEGSPAVDYLLEFSDVAANSWYTEAVRWAAAEQIISGYSEGTFGVNDPVTREQLAAILWRYAGSPAAQQDAAFADAANISSFAATAVRWAKANNIISGVSGDRFELKGGATRAQVAAILYRYLTEKPSGEDTAHKILVAYFSRTGENYSVGSISEGNTAVIAKIIAEETGADLFEIKPVTPYPDNYQEMLAVAEREASENARPAIAETVSAMKDYDTVFIGYPIWNGDMPKIVYTFLESYDFAGKTVIPFNTHEGSGQAGTQRTITSMLVDSTLLNGLAVRGSEAQNSRNEARETVCSWLDGLSLGLEAPADEAPVDSAAKVGAFDLDSGAVLLNSGHTMPIFGIGTYTLSQSEAENSVYWALKAGFRLIDTARIYGNEEGVGRGIQRAIDEGIVNREDIFVTTKMWTSDYNDGESAIDTSLDRLGLDYIDLMILHHSQPSNDVQAYKAMERAVEEGKLRSIGLSNYYTPADFDRLVNATSITPALLQNETHPYHQSTDMKEHLAQYGTVLESWFPLGGRGHTQTLFNDPTISAIAAAHGKSSAQVIIRWHLQAGNIAIPGSSNEDHIKEDFDVFDFALTEAEMAQMTALDKNERFASY